MAGFRCVSPSVTPGDSAPTGRVFDSRLGLYAIFMLSGSAGLIYQVIWARWLGLLFGNTTPSVAIVLAIFMLGLALGSRLAGPRIATLLRPMRAYGWLELGVGAYAILLPFLFSLADRLFTYVVHGDALSPASLAIRAVLSFSLLILPTTLMGATLPLLAEQFRRRPKGTGTWKVGILYAVNTLGAALGALAAGFVLIEWMGERNATIVAALLNFLAAFWGFASGGGPPVIAPAAPRTHHGPTPPAARLTLVLMAVGGALALSSEVLWTRTLEILLGNSTYAFDVILVVYLVGIATGSWAVSWIVPRARRLPLWLVGAQTAVGGWILVAIVLFDHLSQAATRHSFATVPQLTVLATYLAIASLLFPMAFLSGAAFPIATRILDPEIWDATGSGVARVYVWNTVGAVVGSLVAGFGIAATLDYFQSLYLVAALYGITAVGALTVTARGEIFAGARGRVALVGLISVAVAWGAFPALAGGSRYLAHLARQAPGVAVVFHRPGLQGVTTVLSDAREPRVGRVLLVNGNGMTRKVIATKMMAHLPLLVHPDPRKTLVIGFGMGTTYRSAISHGGEVTVVELVREVYEAFDWFFQDAKRVRAYPRGRMVVNDGRNFLKLTRDRFDVITIDPPPPIDAAGVTHLYSREFLELARSRLRDGGILAHFVPLPGNRVGVNDVQTFQMLIRTFTEVFPEVLMVPSIPPIGVHVLGSRSPMRISPEHVRRQLADPAVTRDMQEWGEVPADYLGRLSPPDRAEQAGAAILTDDHPALEFHLLRSLRTGTPEVYPLVIW